ncbi:MAG: glycosyltransferase [Patescibacteria group bacterium]
MKVAILHDYLNQFGGAERVLKTLLDIFPKADLYTLLHDEERTLGLFKNRVKGTSFLDIPLVRRRHRAFIPLMPLATKMLRPKEEYDLVISSTAGYAKGIPVKAKYHICYCHSPLRYAWEADYLKKLSFSPWPLTQSVLYPIASWLKNWDKRASQNVNLFIANSDFIAGKIKSYYGREAEVIYPPVDVKTFYPEPTTSKKNYYLMAGRLLYYKGFDLGIKALNKLGRNLKILGTGPEEEKLKKIADPQLTEFIRYAPDAELRKLYSNAKALIFPQIEDFGLVAAEAQMCGLPVLSFNKGGGKEIVEDRKTGLHFEEQTPEAIINAINDFEKMSFDRVYIARKALRFSEETFVNNIRNTVRKNGFII